MPDYKKMYFQLFNRISDAIRLLQDAQKQAEESYLAGKTPNKRRLRCKRRAGG